MDDEKYIQKKVKNVKSIIEKFEKLAKASDVKIHNIQWDNGSLNVDREDFHTLQVMADGKTVQERFFVEDVIDYPYEDGGVVMYKIENMIQSLTSKF